MEEVSDSSNTNEISVFNKVICFKAHPKGITSISVSGSGTKLVTGSKNGSVRIWDFHGMSKRIRHFREFYPHDCHPVETSLVDYSGNRILICIGDNIVRILDNEGNCIHRTYAGDMYVRDTNNTKGHTHSVKCVAWYPADDNIFGSCSLDGTVRIWNCTSKPSGIDEAIVHSTVMKALDARNTNISQSAGVTILAFDPQGDFVVGGCVDGSVELWNKGKSGNSDFWKEKKPSRIGRNFHDHEELNGLCVCSSELIVSKSEKKCHLWNKKSFVKPVASLDLNGSTGPVGILRSENLLFFADSQREKIQTISVHSSLTLEKLYEIALPDEFGSVQSLTVHEDCYQLFVGDSLGNVCIILNSEKSVNGGKLISPEALEAGFDDGVESAVVDPTVVAYSFYDLPPNIKETRDGNLTVVKLRRFELRQKKNPPDLRNAGSPVLKTTMSQKFMAQFLEEEAETREKRKKERELTGDTDFGSVSLIQTAYSKTQPKPVLDTTPWDESEDYMGQHDMCPRCGLRMCSCGYLELQRARDQTNNPKNAKISRIE